MANYQGKLSAYLGLLVHGRAALKSGATQDRLDTLLLYGALANNPLSARQLAKRTGTDRAALHEWLGAQVTRGHLEYDAARQRYWMTQQQASAVGRKPDLSSVTVAFEASASQTGPFAR